MKPFSELLIVKKVENVCEITVPGSKVVSKFIKIIFNLQTSLKGRNFCSLHFAFCILIFPVYEMFAIESISFDKFYLTIVDPKEIQSVKISILN